MKKNESPKWWQIILVAIIITLAALLACVNMAQAGDSNALWRYDTQWHARLSAGFTLAEYPVLRSQQIEHSAEWALFGALVVGFGKEGLDHYTGGHQESRDGAADAYGALGAYLLLKGGEQIEKRYGWNPFYWRF